MNVCCDRMRFSGFFASLFSPFGGCRIAVEKGEGERVLEREASYYVRLVSAGQLVVSQGESSILYKKPANFTV